MKRVLRVLPALLTLLAACKSTPTEVADLATSQASADFASYRLRRVGLVPFTGEHLSFDDAADLQSSFFAEMSGAVPYEVVPLDPSDIAEIPVSEPFRSGAYKPRTVISVARRFRLDAVLVGTVTDRQLFSPQRIGLQVDLVAAETGLVIWSGSVHLDGAQDLVRHNIKIWVEGEQGDIAEMDWKLSLISPRRFAHFAAFQLARKL